MDFITILHNAETMHKKGIAKHHIPHFQNFLLVGFLSRSGAARGKNGEPAGARSHLIIKIWHEHKVPLDFFMRIQHEVVMDITNEQWEHRAPLQPPKGPRGQGRPVLNEPRAILNGILWIYQ